MRIEELQRSLEAQELHLTERTSEREVEWALKASSSKKNHKLSWSEANKRDNGDNFQTIGNNLEGVNRFQVKKIYKNCFKKFNGQRK